MARTGRISREGLRVGLRRGEKRRDARLPRETSLSNCLSLCRAKNGYRLFVPATEFENQMRGLVPG